MDVELILPVYKFSNPLNILGNTSEKTFYFSKWQQKTATTKNFVIVGPLL